MPDLRIYAAPSLNEVIKQLWRYRSSGILTIWPAISAYQENTRITIELGRPVHVYNGSRWEHATESIIAWLNMWGEIHFSFQATEARLRLPSPTSHTPSQHTLVPQPLLPTNTQSPHMPPAHSRATHPSLRATNQQANSLPDYASRVGEAPLSYDALHEKGKNSFQNRYTTTAAATTIASLTAYGRTFPPANLPRHDRTIFLLVNGKRTVSDLSQLSNRRTEEIYTTLNRLRSLQIIVLETVPHQS